MLRRTFVLLFLLAVASQDDVRGQGIGCGRRPPITGKRIVGGTESSINSWPWMVNVMKNGEQHCGGSLVNNQWVVTAANCFDGSKDPKIYSAVLADHNLSKTDPFEQKMNVNRIILHPNYTQIDPNNTVFPPDYDVALVKLEKAVTFDSRISPICLLSPGWTFKFGKECYVIGWGTTKNTKETAKVLRDAKVPMVPWSECNKKESYNHYIHQRAFCAGYKNGGVDACLYDGGGPLACETGGRYYLTGIVSWEQGCAKPHKYGVYTNMPLLTSWVKKAMATS